MGRGKAGQFPVVVWSTRQAPRVRKAIHQWRSTGGRGEGWRGGGGGRNTGPNHNNMCVWPLLAVQGHCVALVASTPSDFSGSRSPQILPRGGQRAGPVGMNIQQQRAKKRECLKEKENNVVILLGLYAPRQTRQILPVWIRRVKTIHAGSQ